MKIGVLGDLMYEMIEIIVNRGKEVDREADLNQENIGIIWPPLNS